MLYVLGSILIALLLAAPVSACEKDVFVLDSGKYLIYRGSYRGAENAPWRQVVVEVTPPVIDYDVLREKENAALGVLDSDSALMLVPYNAREYMVVDTVLTCPDCWTLKIYDTLWHDSPLYRQVSESNAERWCLKDKNDPGWQEIARPDTTFDTIWLPKVQIWRDSTELSLWRMAYKSWRRSVWIKDSTVDILE